MNKNTAARITERIEEIKKLYGITEPEEYLLNQMVIAIQLLGYSPQLTSKLLKALSAIIEVSVELVEDEKK